MKIRPHQRFGLLLYAIAIVVFVSTVAIVVFVSTVDLAPDTFVQKWTSAVGFVLTVSLFVYGRFDMHKRFKKRKLILQRLDSFN